MQKSRTFLLPILTLTVWLLFGNMAQAQIPDSIAFDRKAQKEHTVHPDYTSVVHDIDLWVRNHTLDNWYLLAKGGPTLYGGYEDYMGPLFGLSEGHLTFSAQAMIGRWVYPKLGYRFGIGTGYWHGFINASEYNPVNMEDDCGMGVCEPGYFGYYYPTSDPNLLIQKWKFMNFTGDLVMKFITTKGYVREQKFVPYMVLGATFLSSLSSIPSSDQSRFGFNAHFGLGLDWRMTEHFSLFGEASVAMQSAKFDREWINGVEKPTVEWDYPAHLEVGVAYRFNWRPEPKRYIWDKLDDSSSVVRHASTLHSFQFKYLIQEYMDTLIVIDTITDQMSPEMLDLMRQRAEQRAQTLVDSIRGELDRQYPDATLRDIFDRNLLPYEMVFFQLDKWDVLPKEETKVRMMADLIKSLPGQTFLLIGSADSKTGTVKRNDFLSVNRADVVYNQLVYTYGIDPSQLKRIYMGGILDYDPFELNRATVIIMDHPKVLAEFNKLRANRQAGGSVVDFDE